MSKATSAEQEFGAGYIGHTDFDWWSIQSLICNPNQQANFWRRPGREFRALRPGEPFFFRLKSPINQIAGKATFVSYSTMPLWEAWDTFGPRNGSLTESEFRRRVSAVLGTSTTPTSLLGCIALAQCEFLDESDWLPVPSSFQPHNVSGSRIDLTSEEGRVLWKSLGCIPPQASVLKIDTAAVPPTKVRRDVVERVGQVAFRLAVSRAYNGECALSGVGLSPALEAAHIVPLALGGPDSVSNGLLLRRDLHRLFDLGYLAFSHTRKCVMSPQIEDSEYYAFLRGAKLKPVNQRDRPSDEYLAWHRENRFLLAA